jgi:pseudaminic acid biosynthesis-associated methylase
MSASGSEGNSDNGASDMEKAMRAKTEQETFWQGSFGDEYTTRNATGPELRRPFFERVLERTKDVRSICELGANRGDNLAALRRIREDFALTGVEINEGAARTMRDVVTGVSSVVSSIQDFDPDQRFDLVFTCGVLIHLNPDDLPAIYGKMVLLSTRYILVNEYFNPRPVEIEYRGHSGRLFKRDFAGEMLDAHPNQLRVVDYGFLWKRIEPGWDDTTWVLMEKAG